MLLVSACLAGIPCRWDGQAKGMAEVMDLVRQGKAIPVCPEQLGGLTTPREPSEGRVDHVVSSSGQDVTTQFERGARIVPRHRAALWLYHGHTQGPLPVLRVRTGV